MRASTPVWSRSRAAVLVLAIAAGCSSTVRYRSVSWRGDECARACQRSRADADQAACLDSCPGLAKERGSCSSTTPSRPDEICADFKESAGKAPIIAAVVVGLAVVAGVVLLALQPPDFSR
jgi:hypothetical protein